MNHYLILKITNEFIWYNETDGIAISRTNLPISYMTFSYNQNIYWKVKMDKFIKESKVLQVEIVDHHVDDLKGFRTQQPKEPIEGLEFIPGKNGELFIWDHLETQLISYTKSKITKHKTASYEPFESKVVNEPGKAPYMNHTKDLASHPVEQELKMSFTTNFSDVTIILGGVKFSHHVSALSHEVEFVISNPHLLPEFDHIKHWFTKRLGIKKIPVEAVIKTKDGKVTEVRAQSRLIDRIDDNLIHGVKVDRTLGLRKKLSGGSVDQSLFTVDEFFGSELDEANLGNVFGQTDKDVLELLLENTEIRNRKELIYLSGKLHSKNHELRFTNHPHFGFVFYVEGETEGHFIWELLNSNATYIWSFDRHSGSIERRYQRTQEILNVILESGRENYKRAYRTKVQDQDLKFNFVYHQNKNSNLVDSFPLWKHRVEEVLT